MTKSHSFGKRFGELVKAKRGLHGFTQEQLAVEVYGKIQRKTHISRLERGKIENPHASTIDEISAVLYLTPEELDSCRRPEQTRLPNDLRDTLLTRYEHKNPGVPKEVFDTLLKKIAESRTEVLNRLSELSVENPRIKNLMAAAQGAIDSGRFDEADDRLADAEEIQLEERTLHQVRRQAEMRVERGRARLLSLEAYTAAQHFEAAAKFLAPFSEVEAATVTAKWGRELLRHGKRYNDEGLKSSQELCRSAIGYWSRDEYPVQWADSQNLLGNALLFRGKRQNGPQGLKLLHEATQAFHAALVVRTRQTHPVDWAKTQNNLGIALRNLGTRTPGRKGTHFLSEAVKAYNAALEVRTRDDHPVNWATTQNNLGNALRKQGLRVGGIKGLQLIEKSLNAYDNAIQIHTRKAHPFDWAMAHSNLGIAFVHLAKQKSDNSGTQLICEAKRVCEEALKVYTRKEHPIGWAEAHENLGYAYAVLSNLQPRRTIEHLNSALREFDLALEIITPQHMPYDFENIYKARTKTVCKLTELSKK